VRLSLGRGDAQVKEVVRNFLPVVAGRGVVQLSAYVDMLIASWMVSGTVAAFGYAQTIYLLPVSLFGMAVSAAALPSMSADAGVREKLHAQTEAGLRAIAFPVVPTVAAFLRGTPTKHGLRSLPRLRLRRFHLSSRWTLKSLALARSASPW